MDYLFRRKHKYTRIGTLARRAYKATKRSQETVRSAVITVYFFADILYSLDGTNHFANAIVVVPFFTASSFSTSHSFHLLFSILILYASDCLGLGQTSRLNKKQVIAILLKKGDGTIRLFINHALRNASSFRLYSK